MNTKTIKTIFAPCGAARWMVLYFVAAILFAHAQTPAPTPPTPPAPAVEAPSAPEPAKPTAPPSATVTIGGTAKAAIGKVVDTEKADNGCYLAFKNDKGDEFIELGLPEFCTKKHALKGKRWQMIYRMETVPAAECNGAPKCKKTENTAVIVEVKALD